MRYLLTLLGPVLLLAVYAVSTGLWSLPAVLILNAIFSGWGIAIGFHKVFSHKTHQPRSTIQLLLLVAGTAAGQGSSIQWRAAHDRYHHNGVRRRRRRSPTSSERLGWWYHLLSTELRPTKEAERQLCGEDRSPIGRWHRRIDASYLQWFYGIGGTLSLTVALISLYSNILGSSVIEHITVINAAVVPTPRIEVLLNVVYTSLAYGVGSWAMAVALSMVQTMVAVTLGYKPIHEWPTWLQPWFVNRTYVTNDDTVNLPVLAWATWGQTLCNNHAAKPFRYSFKMRAEGEDVPRRWYEKDPTMLVEPILRLFKGERRANRRQEKD